MFPGTRDLLLFIEGQQRDNKAQVENASHKCDLLIIDVVDILSDRFQPGTIKLLQKMNKMLLPLPLRPLSRFHDRRKSGMNEK